MSGFNSTIKNLEQFKSDVKDEVDEALEEAMEDVNRRLKWALRAQDSVATGTLYESLDSHDAFLRGQDEFSRYQIRGAEHWKYLEFGTGMGSKYKSPDPVPPYVPIYRWVIAKGITPDRDKGQTTQADVAYAIQQSLSSGTHSNPFVRPVWRSARGRKHVIEKVGDAYERAMHRAF